MEPADATPIKDDERFQALRVRDASGDLLTAAEQAWFDAFARRAPMPAGFKCPTCGETFATCAAFGSHRREAHLARPKIAPGAKDCVYGKRGLKHGGFASDAEALAFVRGPGSAFRNPKVRRSARKLVRVLAPQAQAVARSARPRECHATSRARARSPGSDDGPPEHLRPRPCERCGETFKPARQKQTVCLAPECRRARNADKQRRHKQSVRVGRHPLRRLDDRIAAEVRRLHASGELNGDEALTLLTNGIRRRVLETGVEVLLRGGRPPEVVLEALRVAA